MSPSSPRYSPTSPMSPSSPKYCKLLTFVQSASRSRFLAPTSPTYSPACECSDHIASPFLLTLCFVVQHPHIVRLPPWILTVLLISFQPLLLPHIARHHPSGHPRVRHKTAAATLTAHHRLGSKLLTTASLFISGTWCFLLSFVCSLLSVFHH